MIRTLGISLIAVALSGCIAAINERSMIDHMARDLVCGIDESVIDEKDHLLPSGWLTKPYSPAYWQEYWNHRAYYLGQSDLSHDSGYSGPAARTLILYALRQRQEENLPDLVPDEKNSSFVPELYAELKRNPRSSCEILSHQSPVCTLGPAQRPAVSQFQRPCTGSQ
jgi:hypothetical protein